MKLIKLIAYNWSRFKQRDFLSVAVEDRGVCTGREQRAFRVTL